MALPVQQFDDDIPVPERPGALQPCETRTKADDMGVAVTPAIFQEMRRSDNRKLLTIPFHQPSDLQRHREFQQQGSRPGDTARLGGEAAPLARPA